MRILLLIEPCELSERAEGEADIGAGRKGREDCRLNTIRVLAVVRYVLHGRRWSFRPERGRWTRREQDGGGE